jgi:hypothetical protein
MAPVFTEQYQLGHGGSLVFEHDLTTLTLFLNRLYPEFKGAVLNEFLKIPYDHALVHYSHQKDFQDKSN